MGVKPRVKSSQHRLWRSTWLWALLCLLTLCLGVLAWQWWQPKPVLVAIVHSQTGTMASAERAVLQMTLAAIEQVNRQGGVLGRAVQPIVLDGASDAQQFARVVDQVLNERELAVVFGGWTSASRRAMIPVIERHQSLLIYPVQYEGLENSQRVIYTGTTPNQQLNPALTWMLEKFGKKVLLVGSDYIFPRVENDIAKVLLKRLDAQVCGEYYIKLGTGHLEGLAQQIEQCRPDFILNTVNGYDNLPLLSLLRQEGARTPIMSLSMDEQQLHQLIVAIGEGAAIAHYASASYFSSDKQASNQHFKNQVSVLAKDFAIDPRYMSAAMKSAWDGVMLWAQAVNASAELAGDQVVHALEGMSVASATGPVSVDQLNRHLWQPIYIGEAQKDGQFKIVWQTHLLVEPEPWPLGLSQAMWQLVVQGWYDLWGQQWQAP